MRFFAFGEVLKTRLNMAPPLRLQHTEWDCFPQTADSPLNGHTSKAAFSFSEAGFERDLPNSLFQI
jgi:hypothetical protein